MPHALFGIVNPRVVCAPRNGPPNGPLALRVSATRHGVTGTKRRPAVGTTTLKVAVTVCACVMLIWQDVVPGHAPPHPAKNEPDTGVAVTVTHVPFLELAATVKP